MRGGVPLIPPRFKRTGEGKRFRYGGVKTAYCFRSSVPQEKAAQVPPPRRLAKMALPLSRVSWYSSSGTESATIPPPTWK